jgi:NTE family protein
VRACTSSDTILVQVNPVERPGTPRSAREIFDRLNEVSFNAPLLKELRMIAVLRQVSNPGDCEGARWADMRIHRIASPLMLDLGYSSKLNGEWDFLTMLRDEGRRCAEEFLTVHRDDIGHRSTLDLDVLLDADPEMAPAKVRSTPAEPKGRSRSRVTKTVSSVTRPKASSTRKPRAASVAH